MLESISVNVKADKNVMAVGRFPKGEKGLLCWTGSSLVIHARLREWSAAIEADWAENTPYMGILADGVPVARFALRKGKHQYTLLTGMDETAEHELTLFRDTQPMSGEDGLMVRVSGMTVAGELMPVREKPLIEVIGDSLTTGEGTVGPRNGMEWRSVWISGMHSWAQAMCLELDARGEWVSQSGWGVYTGWDNDSSSVLSRIYESAAAHSPYSGIRHDFDSHPVKAVVINLGTNDSNALKNLPEKDRPERLGQIKEAAVSLLRQIHRCRPGTPVLFTYGMCGQDLTECLRSAVQEDAETAGSAAVFMELPACSGEELGSRGHPGVAFQRQCGRLIADKLRQMKVF